MPVKLANCTWRESMNPKSGGLFSNSAVSGMGGWINNVLSFDSNTCNSLGKTHVGGNVGYLYATSNRVVTRIKRHSLRVFLSDGIASDISGSGTVDKIGGSSFNQQQENIVAQHEGCSVLPVVFLDGHGLKISVPNGAKAIGKAGKNSPVLPGNDTGLYFGDKNKGGLRSMGKYGTLAPNI